MYVLKIQTYVIKLQTERLLKNDHRFVNFFVKIKCRSIFLDTLPAHVHLSLTVTKQWSTSRN